MIIGSLIKVIALLSPWPVKRFILVRFFGYRIHPSARIGFAWIFPVYLEMGEYSRISSFTVAIHLDRMVLAPEAIIERLNWITGFPTGADSAHFCHQPERVSALQLGASAAITKQHHIDCTNTIRIGAFSIVAGYSSQFLTHSIDLQRNRQHSAPITIGDYCFVGTGCILLGGAVLPSHSVLGAMSLLSTAMDEPWSLYAGQPAVRKRAIDPSAAFFTRSRGFVD
jgi:acetyltransferase-like isoleucine patch superfamily enzyme